MLNRARAPPPTQSHGCARFNIMLRPPYAHQHCRGSMLMSICGSFRNVQAIVLRSVCLDNDSHFPDEAFSMAIHDAGMFTVKKTNRLKILQDVIDRNLRPGQAAEMLSITPRHCSRLLKRYRQLGPLGMNNHSRGRVGNRLLPTSLIDQALCIIRVEY
uniref:helix-turn-helix domain-containing protein n=6 Tax=Salmonella enterica TaxID=28901 RepID=UPI003A94B34F